MHDDDHEIEKETDQYFDKIDALYTQVVEVFCLSFVFDGLTPQYAKCILYNVCLVKNVRQHFQECIESLQYSTVAVKKSKRRVLKEVCI